MKRTLFPFTGLALVLATWFAATPTFAAEQQGVSKNEIVIGTIQDLSGPLAGYGKQSPVSYTHLTLPTKRIV